MESKGFCAELLDEGPTSHKIALGHENRDNQPGKAQNQQKMAQKPLEPGSCVHCKLIPCTHDPRGAQLYGSPKSPKIQILDPPGFCSTASMSCWGPRYSKKLSEHSERRSCS